MQDHWQFQIGAAMEPPNLAIVKLAQMAQVFPNLVHGLQGVTAEPTETEVDPFDPFDPLSAGWTTEPSIEIRSRCLSKADRSFADCPQAAAWQEAKGACKQSLKIMREYVRIMTIVCNLMQVAYYVYFSYFFSGCGNWSARSVLHMIHFASCTTWFSWNAWSSEMHQEPLPSGRRASVASCHLELGLTWTLVAVVCHGGVLEICPCQQFRTTWTPVFHPPMQCLPPVRPRAKAAKVVSCRVSWDLSEEFLRSTRRTWIGASSKIFAKSASPWSFFWRSESQSLQIFFLWVCSIL